ncbi:MAG TPA: hypothetical protein VGP08_21465 [Pyrinomonadaceae bacterium]|nr:hypothetical protein [Pyrinomonadaceae bacterium]
MDALRLLRELIAIPSVNPMREGACGDVERGVADHLEATLRREGIECERQHVSGGQSVNVVPDLCEFEVEQIERAVRLYERLLESWKGERGGARVVNFKHTEAAP